METAQGCKRKSVVNGQREIIEKGNANYDRKIWRSVSVLRCKANRANNSGVSRGRGFTVMKKITLFYPDTMEESEAVKYLPDVFNSKRHDYKSKKATGKNKASVLQFMDDRIGLFWIDKSGYALELREEFYK